MARILSINAQRRSALGIALPSSSLQPSAAPAPSLPPASSAMDIVGSEEESAVSLGMVDKPPPIEPAQRAVTQEMMRWKSDITAKFVVRDAEMTLGGDDSDCEEIFAATWGVVVPSIEQGAAFLHEVAGYMAEHDQYMGFTPSNGVKVTGLMWPEQFAAPSMSITVYVTSSISAFYPSQLI